MQGRNHPDDAVPQACPMENDYDLQSIIWWLGEPVAVINMSLWTGCSSTHTASAPCLVIQPASVSTVAGPWCLFYGCRCRSPQQTGANPWPLGECHDNRPKLAVCKRFPRPDDREKPLIQRSRSCMDPCAVTLSSMQLSQKHFLHPRHVPAAR